MSKLAMKKDANGTLYIAGKPYHHGVPRLERRDSDHGRVKGNGSSLKFFTAVSCVKHGIFTLNNSIGENVLC